MSGGGDLKFKLKSMLETLKNCLSEDLQQKQPFGGDSRLKCDGKLGRQRLISLCGLHEVHLEGNSWMQLPQRRSWEEEIF